MSPASQRDGGEPVIAKNRNRVVGWYTPVKANPR